MNTNILTATGLQLFPKDRKAALVATLSSVVGVTVFILILDGLLFRHALPDGYEALFTSPLLPRTPLFFAASMLEEIQYRLLLTTILVVLATAIHRRPLQPWAFLLIIAGVQLFNVWVPVSNYPLYGSLRYWLVGSVWGVLYWRHGFLPALAGHATTHLLLDPTLLGVLLLTQ